MSIGKIAEFNVHKDDWKLYVERLEQYFVVNKIPENLHVPTLITVMGAESYELLVNLCTPNKPKVESFERLSDIMSKHLQPKPSELAERYKFRHRKQKEGETIAEYVAILKKMSKTCEFGSWLEESLRDQLVCGIASENIRQRLFAESKLDFSKAYKLASSLEAAEKDAAAVEGPKSSVETGASTVTCQAMMVRRKAAGVADRGGQPGVARQDVRERRDVQERRARAGSAMSVPVERARFAERARPQRPCRVCGANHNEATCKFARYVCKVCNRQGHLRRMCPNLVEQYQVDVQTPSDNEEADSDEVIFVNVCKLSILSCKPIYITLNVHNKNISMECDTGSAVSCISQDCYNRLFNDLPLQPCKLTLRYYTGETVKPLGIIRPLVRYKDRREFLELLVIEKGKTVLLGRHWLAALKIQLPDLNYNVHNILENSEFELSSFSSKYCNVFTEGLGRFTGGAVSIHVRSGARPVFMRARPLAYALREPVERALDQLVRDGVLTPVERSDWATPIVPVVKKDGSIRICADYKLTLNKVIEIDRYPLPRVEDLLFRLRGGEYYSKIDLSQAYAQFELDDTKKYTVINTHKGLYMYNRLVYGLASSPGIFQRRIEQLFAGMPCVGVFLDDIIVTGSTKSDHIYNLHKVFQQLQDYGLRVKKEKCVFFSKSVSYLGHVISKDGVHTCPEKVKAVRETPAPTNTTELRAFIGLVMYYAKFIKNISTVLAPLYKLLKSGTKYSWSEDCQNAFVRVKRLLVDSKVLIYYNPELPLVLTTDASSVGVGAVISHITADGERPVAYASRSLTPAERAYAQIDREALGIVFGVRKFHQYLYGRHFTLRTDHKPLTYIFGNKTGIPVMAASRLQRWAVLLAGYNYNIEYIASSKNSADALSRLPSKTNNNVCRIRTENTYVNFVENFLPITSNDIKTMIPKDKVLGRVMLYIQSGWPPDCPNNDDIKPFFSRRNELYIECGCIMWGYRMVIPQLCQGQILKQLHSSHMGIVKMKSLARSYVWWPNIDKDIEGLCKSCETCATEARAPPRATIQPWPYCAQPWTRLHIDFLGPYRGMTFLVLTDSSSKWLEIFEMPRTTASNVIKVLRSTFARFGLPQQLVSDQGPPFTSIEFKNFLTNNGIRQYFSPAYHPSSNGAAENAVNICKRTIKKAIRDRVDVDSALQTFLLAYRNTVHSTTGETPAMMLQKRTLRSRLDLLRTERSIGDRVHKAQQRQIDSAGGVSRFFDAGDPVWMRDYGSSDKWVKGTISNVDSARRYVIARDNGQFIKRHVDQIRRRSRASIGGPNTEEGETIENENSVPHAGDNLIPSGKNGDECEDESVCERDKPEQLINNEVELDPVQPLNESPGLSTQHEKEYPKRTRKPVIRFQCT